MRPIELRRRLSRTLRRHRRPVAAALAGTGVLLALSTLRPAPALVVGPGPAPTSLRPGEVAIPIALASAAIAGTLAAGDVVDVVGVDEDAASVVAPLSRVLEVPDSTSGFGSTASAVVLLAVREKDALGLSAATADGPVTVLIRTRSAARATG